MYWLPTGLCPSNSEIEIVAVVTGATGTGFSGQSFDV